MLLIIILCVRHVISGDLSTRIALPQGVLTGVRMETERGRIAAYLGIPYALPPLGTLRFAPPERHPGWNQSLVAEHFRPDCLQPREDAETVSEDCLYLNVFAPETDGFKEYSVVIFIQGENFVTSPTHIYPVQELANEGVIVVTFSYRLNVFGFLNFGSIDTRGNFGILDQYLAMLWVQENINYFGGNPKNVTLMGHGAGAAAVAIHMTSPRTKNMFQRAILMSGSVYSPLYHPESTIYTSVRIAKSLGCYVDKSKQDLQPILACLRQKPSQEILLAFENLYRTGNWTASLVPAADSFLPARMQYLPLDPREVLNKGDFHKVPTLIGLTTNEGNLLLEQWSDLKKQDDQQLMDFLEQTALKSILDAARLNSSASFHSVRWRYLLSTSKTKLEQLLEVYADAMFEAPFWKLLRDLSKSSTPIFAYIFSQNTLGLDNSNITGHGTDLLYLFGPGQFEKVVGRKMRSNEERLSLRMKRLWINFMKTGRPYPPTYGAGLWDQYSPKLGNYLDLFSDDRSGRVLEQRLISDSHQLTASFWNELLPVLDKATETVEEEFILGKILPKPGECASYRNAMLTTISFLIILLASLVLVLILLKKRTKERDRGIL